MRKVFLSLVTTRVIVIGELCLIRILEVIIVFNDTICLDTNFK